MTPPTAVDALGNALESDIVLTDEGFDQVTVLPTTADAYPVVAQVRAGSTLINRFTWTGNNIEVHVTPLVAVVDFFTVAVAGWQQLVSLQTPTRQNTLNGNGTYNQQWQCHANGKAVIGIAGFTGIDPRPAWGLEGHRGKRADFAAYWLHGCNW